MKREERLNLIREKERRLAELTKQRNETMRELFRIYEEEKGNDKNDDIRFKQDKTR